MKLDDFLKRKKVRCVKGYGRHLTVGETYHFLGLSVPNNLVQVENDNGFITEYDFEAFEPVLDSAENPQQGVELTPEFEAVAPKFKVGDKVYKYGETDVKTVLEVFENGYMRISNYPYRVNHEVVCHATPENHAMLSKPYPHIEFEQPPKELKGSDLARAMLDKGWVSVPCYISDSSDTHALERQTRNAAVIIGTHKDHPSFFIYGSGKSFIYYAVPFDPRTGEPLTEAVLDE